MSDAVPQEASVTPNVWRYSLERGTEYWKKQIIKEMAVFERKDRQAWIVDANYDIKVVAKKMEMFYIKKVE